MSESNDRYSFIAEWYDDLAGLTRKFQFLFYAKDNAIEMFDMKNHKSFLKRTKYDQVRLSDMYIGSTFSVFSRQLNLVEYGDESTKDRLSHKKERTLGMIKPDAISKMGDILDLIYQRGFMVTRIKMCQLNRNDALELYKEHKGKPFLDDLLNFITCGPVVAFELMGENAISNWRECLGPTDPSEARQSAPRSIRARFGTNTTKNACHGSDSPVSAAREVDFFFPANGRPRQNTAQISKCTCCVIKPHAVAAGVAGNIISKIIEAGFEVSSLGMFNMEKANAEEFYEIYKGVVSEYQDMVSQLTSGPCIAMEIRAEDAPTKFREMCGPPDPEIARHLRPRTLRALYGADKVKNAVHCTDLPEDGELEVEYFFRILDN